MTGNTRKRELLDAMTILCDFRGDSEFSATSLADTLQKRLSNLENSMSNDSVHNSRATVSSFSCADDYVNFDPYALYIETLTRHLSSLAELFSSASGTENEVPELMLSINERSLAERSIEFLIGLAVLPLSDDDLSSSLHRRLNVDSSASAKKKIILLSNMFESVRRATSNNRSQLLVEVTQCLYELWRCSEFRALMTSKFLAELLSCVLQLSSVSPFCTPDDSKRTWDERLTTIISESYKPDIIRHLLAFQSTIPASSTSKSSQADKISMNWVRRACGQQLTTLLTSKRGVISLVEAVNEVGENSLNDDWKKRENVCNLIASCPSIYRRNPDKYYRLICEQLCEADVRQRFPRVFVCLIRKLYSKWNAAVKTIILEPLFQPLMDCDNLDNAQLPSTSQLTSSVDTLHQLYVSTSTDTFTDTLRPVLGILLQMFAQIKSSVAIYGRLLEEIIQAYFSNANPSMTCQITKRWIIFNRPGEQRPVSFLCNAIEGISCNHGATGNENDVSLETRIEIVVEILKSLSPDNLRRFLTEFLSHCFDSEESDCDASVAAEKHLETLVVLSFVAAILENVNIADYASAVILFCKTMLETNMSQTDDEHDDDVKETKEKNLMLLFGLIAAVLSTSADKQIDTSDLRSVVKVVSETHPNDNIRAMAADLAFVVDGTRAAADPSTSVGDRTRTTDNLSLSEETGLARAIADLDDALLPVRSHALVALTNIMKLRTAYAHAAVEEIVAVVTEKCLNDDDSYVYLPAINCLAEAGNLKPTVVLPVLMELFGNIEKPIELRLKCGESVVKISREMGDLAPFYGNALVDEFLQLMRQNDDMIKCSCLANIAEICRLMRFRLNRHVHELCYCSKQLLQWERNELVRRAAMQVLTSLSANGDSFLEALEGDARTFYRFVTSVYESDEDQLVRLHAQLCLENLGDTAKKLLTGIITPM